MSLVDALLLEPYRDPREVYIALRTDGLKGSGTIDDPFDGGTLETAPVTATSFSSTGSQGREAIVTAPASLALVDGDVVAISGVTGGGATFWNGNFPIFNVSEVNNVVTFSYWVKRKGSVLAPDSIPLPTQGDTILIAKMVFRFDDLMHELTALPDTSALIHIGPGVFETRGSQESSFIIRPQLWRPKSKMKFRGSGMDVTTLRLVYCDIENSPYYAIGGAIYSNITDHVEVSDLTVDCNLKEIPGNPNYRNQPVTRGFDYARVTCSAVALRGAFCRICRVKAVNWGTQSIAEAFVLAVSDVHPDFRPAEKPNQVIEDCVCVQPNENNLYTSTVIHMGGGHEETRGRHSFLRASALRRNYVDCGFVGGRSNFLLHVPAQNWWEDTGETSHRVWFLKTTTPHGLTTGNRGYITDVDTITPPGSPWNDYFEFEYVDEVTLKVTFPEGAALPSQEVVGHRLTVGTYFNGLSSGVTNGGLVEQNLVVNTSSAGPYQDTGSTKELIVRHNVYLNVASSTNIANGNIYSAPGKLNAIGLASLTFVAGGFAEGLSPIVGTARLKHTLTVGDRIEITGATPDDYNGYFEITAATDITFQYKLPSSGSLPAASGPLTVRRIWGIDRLVVESNFIELRLLAANEFGTPGGVRSSDSNSLIATPPVHTHGEILIRNNTMQMVDGQTGPAFSAWGMLIAGAKHLSVEDNVVDVPNANPLREWRSGTVRFFNNQSAGGALIQGVNGDTPTVKQTELAVQIEDALLLNL